MLDIGCATGVFVDAAAAAGFKTVGIELSRSAGNEAGKNHEVHDKPLSEFGWKNRSDVIILWGVIEHLRDPGREMRLVWRGMTTCSPLPAWKARTCASFTGARRRRF